MFKVMVRKPDAKTFKSLDTTFKTFAQAAFALSRMNLDYDTHAAKITKGRKVLAKRGY